MVRLVSPLSLASPGRMFPPIFRLHLIRPPTFFFLYALAFTSTHSTMDGEIAQHGGDSDREMTRLWRTWRTVYEMLADRVRP
jgi:hypothetical protein